MSFFHKPETYINDLAHDVLFIRIAALSGSLITIII
jgi:hypothetical protein